MPHASCNLQSAAAAAMNVFRFFGDMTHLFWLICHYYYRLTLKCYLGPRHGLLHRPPRPEPEIDPAASHGLRRVLSASGHRLLFTASTAGSTKLPVPISHLRRLAQAGRLADIDAALAPLLPSQCIVVLSALSAAGLPDRASALLKTIRSPTAAHLNALLASLLCRRRLARLVPYILSAHPSVPRNTITNSIHAKALCLRSGAGSAMHLLQLESPPSIQQDKGDL
ncbi:hypothetical protein GUJ93_ZPchr0005g14638 [Zizania palustris]|uniref:Uncharacterized protein n=1 Tax=Zizania palustris TaxID=103762 RepID=A0A8J5W107_ZIZPA|nr:hypothetical protein GUJ93_ZPchr0005g14638 [Zizania palustris]